MSDEGLARRFHETYERLAPQFGYETREETRAFDPASPNGRLMVAVCAELFPTTRAEAFDVERLRGALRDLAEAARNACDASRHPSLTEALTEADYLASTPPKAKRQAHKAGCEFSRAPIRLCDCPKAEPLDVERETLERVNTWLVSVAECDLDEIVADGGITAGMVIQKEAEEQSRRILAALKSQPATDERKAAEHGALADIAAERRRQIEAKGWTPEYDDQHGDGSLATAAACYAAPGSVSFAHDPALARGVPANLSLLFWPWEFRWWKPKDRRRDLIRAGALIVAEIERLDRLSPREASR